MINQIIRWSIDNRQLVILLSLVLVGLGGYALKKTPIDALPDLSDVQVIIKTHYAGQAPEVIETQITYPLSSAMMSVPGAVTVRGFSFFGDSYVYVIFDESTDIYWARARVLEYLSQINDQLPENVKPQLGPDASGVGWVYLYALIDKTGQHDLSDLRSLQDWFLKFELQSVAGVSEVAPIGGMVKQYQIELEPNKLRAYNMPIAHVETAIKRSNQEVGGAVVEMAEAEYMVTASGYLSKLEHIEQIPLGINEQGVALQLKDIAQVKEGPQIRRSIAELNGEGEVVGGIVTMRSGENAQRVIEDVKAKLAALQHGLPDGVELVTVYDRTTLIKESVNHLADKLIEEFVIVALVCVVFLFHVRSSLVAIISLPIGVLVAFTIMYWQGLNANIMSLGGIVIAIGAMVDGAIVMIENMHKHMEKTPLTPENRWQVVASSASEVGKPLFFSLLIITVSFIPVFTLEAQEGRLFAPLAFTKTYAMAASAILAITLVPVLMGYFVRGRVLAEHKNPLNKFLHRHYIAILAIMLRRPKTSLIVVFVLGIIGFYPINKIGSEFIPPLNEGDLMYMPTTYPGISIGKAREILQQTDKLIKTVPEVATVFGKVGRAETATDPAPLSMIETFIQFKPKSQWRQGMTMDKLTQELDQLVSIPGVSNAWVMPIKTRIDMLATGIKTPVGIKISGAQLSKIQEIGKELEVLLPTIAGTASVYAERVASGRYIDIDINRKNAARYGLSIADIQQIIASAIGGKNLTFTVEGVERYPVNMRYAQHWRSSPETIAQIPIINKQGRHLMLGDVATISIKNGPAGIKSENARRAGWVFVDIADVDVGSYVAEAQALLSEQLHLPAGYSIQWSGQYQYMQRALDKLMYILPLTLVIIIILLFLNFKRFTEVGLILLTLPFALIGSLWLMYWQGFNYSVAVAVGFIALIGVVIEIGVIMLVYLNQTYQALIKQQVAGEKITEQQLFNGILYGAGQRIRPIMMTSLAIILGLLPVLYGDGAGSEVMSRIATPMVGGMATAMLLTLFVLPCCYYLWRKISMRKIHLLSLK